jgi:hypothetical protein
MDQASELFKANEDHEILKHLKAAGSSGDQQKVTEMTVKFEEHMQQLEEVWNMHAVSYLSPCVIHCERGYSTRTMCVFVWNTELPDS